MVYLKILAIGKTLMGWVGVFLVVKAAFSGNIALAICGLSFVLFSKGKLGD